MSKLTIDRFKNDIRFRDKIEHIETFKPRDASYKKVNNLSKPISNYLERENIKLYHHQALSFEKIRDNKNIIITTPTASGKTLAFNLPVLERLEKNNKATALYIYPAKALANDQLKVLKNLEKELEMDFKPRTYDGDTVKNEKYGIRQNSKVVLSNPYQLHHILGWHHQWKRFYSNLEFIVIDEAHYYKGIFGSNVALLIRRLKRIANFYGSNPQFILSSATLANPIELAEKLTGESFELINKDTSPSGEKDFILYNPYKNYKRSKKNSHESPSIHQETEHIFLYLLLKDIQTLCFTVSRKTTELIAMWAKNDMMQSKRKLASRITSYRAGFRAEERRQIEAGLKNREYLGVTCTNALELGINIGTLDAVIISGYPGTMVSLFQQGGRCGRGSNKSLVILLAFENQLDQYFMKNPKFLFDKPHENAIIDLNNEILIKAHILCACYEAPLSLEDIEEMFNSQIDLKNILNDLLISGKLQLNPRGLYIYPNNDGPSFSHSLDQLSSERFKVMDNKQNLLEILEKSQVYREAHEGAVLIHKGETYIVKDVNLAQNYVNVVKQNVSYHTMVLKDVDIKIVEKIKKINFGSFTVHFGKLEVSEDFHKYKKMQFSKTIGTYILDLPPLKFQTKGLWFTVDKEVEDHFKNEDDDVFRGGLHGVEHALIGLYPLHVMCDRFDIGGLSTNYHADTQEASIFIYDAYEGGIGICEKAIEVFNSLVKSTKELLDSCECRDGCPKCIYSPKCGNENKPLDKNATKYILDYISKEMAKEPSKSSNFNKQTTEVIESVTMASNSRTTNKITVHNKNDDLGHVDSASVDGLSSLESKESSTSVGTLGSDECVEGSNSVEEYSFDSIEYKYREALDFYDIENYGYAKDLLVDIINIDKSFADAWYLLGDILYQQGDIKGGINFLKRALNIDAGHIEANKLYLELKDKS